MSDLTPQGRRILTRLRGAAALARESAKLIPPKWRDVIRLASLAAGGWAFNRYAGLLPDEFAPVATMIAGQFGWRTVRPATPDAEHPGTAAPARRGLLDGMTFHGHQ